MPIVTRFSHLSDIEFERELEHRARSGQLVLGEETTRELMERVRRWVEYGEESDVVEELQEEVRSLETEIDELKGELERAYS